MIITRIDPIPLSPGLLGPTVLLKPIARWGREIEHVHPVHLELDNKEATGAHIPPFDHPRSSSKTQDSAALVGCRLYATRGTRNSDKSREL